MMRKHTAILILIIGVMLLSACGPSEKAVQEALAKTQMAQPSPTIETIQAVEPTSIPDSWVIDGDLRDYLLTEEDIVKEGYDFHYTKFKFYEPEYETTNDDLIESDDYDEVDEALIFDLGRITSWDRQFMKSEKDSNGNITSESLAVRCKITSFKTVDAAKQAVERYSLAEKPGYNLSYFNKNIDLGDNNVIYRGGLMTGIEFSYRNVVVRTLYAGKPDLEITERFAQIVFEKLQTARLVEPPEASVVKPSNSELNSDVTKTNKSFGFYLVGSEIASGNWRNSGNSDGCYWAITDRKGEIIENFIGMTGGTMYIPTTAYQVQLEKECGMWEYLGN